MSEVIRVLAVVAVIGYVIGRQLMGEPLRGKRVVVLMFRTAPPLPDLATLARLAGEWLAARRERGR